MRTVLAAVALRIQARLEEQSLDKDLKVGEWAIVKEPGTDDASGRIRFRLGNAGDARRIEKAIHSSPIPIGGDMVTIQVSNPILDKLPCVAQGKGQGAHPIVRMGSPPKL